MAIPKVLWYVYNIMECYAADKRIKQFHENWHKRFSKIDCLMNKQITE